VYKEKKNKIVRKEREEGELYFCSVHPVVLYYHTFHASESLSPFRR
jgi:hypothetical protein